MIFAIPYSVSRFLHISTNCFQHAIQAPTLIPNSPRSLQIFPKASQDRSKRRSGGLFETSWALTLLSWRALGRSWNALGTLLGRSWDALGRSWALLAALERSWDRFGTLWARFRDLQGSILSSPELLQEISEQPKRRAFRKSAESCPTAVREDSENQIQQRWIASSLHRSPRG